jgi:serine/threonine protein kinase
MRIYLAEDGQKTGPHELNEIKQFLADGKVLLEDPAFFDKCKDWSTVSKIPGIEIEEGENLKIGSVFGQYRVSRKLGQGGMGEVYEVVHEVLGTRHALKLLANEVMEVDGALERFEREAKVMARLKHSGIVGVDDFGETAGRYWLRMELMNGRDFNEQRVVTLEEYLNVRGGRLSEEESIKLLDEILQALDYAHQKGLVHQDLKPANVLFEGEKLKISDFGLVNAAGADWLNPQSQNTVVSEQDAETMVETSTGNSRSRAIMGTLSFMSPEQKSGQSVDHRSDLFAVGLIAFRLFTEKTPGFKSPSEMVEGLSPHWDKWLQRALEHDPSDRFSSASEMAKALNFDESVLAGSSDSVPEMADAENNDLILTGDPLPREPKTSPLELIKKSINIVSHNTSTVLEKFQTTPFGQKIDKEVAKAFILTMIAGTAAMFALLFVFILWEGDKSPAHPEDLASESLECVIEEDFDTFLNMTHLTSSVSQWEEIYEDLLERKVAFLEKEMDKATEKNGRRKLEDQIEELNYLLEYDLEFLSLNSYLTNTIEELDYEEWKEMKEDYKTLYSDALQEKIEVSDDSKQADSWKKDLSEARSLTFGKADYNDWSEEQKERTESWTNAILNVHKEGKTLGINWEDVEFEYPEFDREKREQIDDYDISFVFSYRKKNYKIELGVCTDSSLGILVNELPSGPRVIK